MTTGIDYHDYSQWPTAMIRAEELVQEQVDGGGIIDSYIAVDQRTTGDGFMVSYSTSEDDVRILRGELRLDMAEWMEYLFWKREVIKHRQDRKWSQVTEALRDAGFYPTDSVGLKMALKIWEIVNQSDTAMSAMQILYFEIRLENHLNLNSTDVLWKNQIVELPALYGDGVEMNRTAKRALKNLVNAGLLEAVGKTKGMSYRIPNRVY